MTRSTAARRTPDDLGAEFLRAITPSSALSTQHTAAVYLSLNRTVVSPIEIRSPSLSSWVVTFVPLTKVPLWLWRSSSMYFPAHLRIWQCLREQLPSLGMGMSAWTLRPRTMTSLMRETTLAGCPGGVHRTNAMTFEI